MYSTISSSHQIRFNEIRNIIREPVDSGRVYILSTHICPDCFVKKQKNALILATTFNVSFVTSRTNLASVDSADTSTQTKGTGSFTKIK